MKPIKYLVHYIYMGDSTYAIVKFIYPDGTYDDMDPEYGDQGNYGGYEDIYGKPFATKDVGDEGEYQFYSYEHHNPELLDDLKLAIDDDDLEAYRLLIDLVRSEGHWRHYTGQTWAQRMNRMNR